MTNDKDSAVLADEAREQVAKAILNHRSPMQPDTEWAISADETREWYRELADAAITAWNKRQPTQSDALREAVIEECANALEADAMKCDCAALEERECGCGAWCEWKSITSARAVEIVRELVDKP